MKKFLYFQPEYVGKFKCDGSKCHARCCKNWKITIDEATYKKYSRIKPKSKAKEITSHMKFDSGRGVYVVQLSGEKDFLQKDSSNSDLNTGSTYKAKDISSNIARDDIPIGHVLKNLLKDMPCPFLTENKLCRLQADYGEEFLSQTCTTYPRHTYVFGDFFERSLALSCPVAAEMVLFETEPIKFLFVDVDEKTHSNGGKIVAQPFRTEKFLADEFFAIQGTMISILQERRLSINQRLIVLGFFAEDLEKLMSVNVSSKEESLNLIRALRKLTADYNPRMFLRQGVPPAIEEVNFNAKNFLALMIAILEPIFFDAYKNSLWTRKYFDGIIEILQLNRADKTHLNLDEITENYMNLADERKNFSDKYSTFLENYLVNEFFMNLYPWKLEGGTVKNFFVFVMTYKVFELIIFSATRKGFDTKEDLLYLVDQFTRKIDHNNKLQEKSLELLKQEEDTAQLMESLFEQ